MNKSVKNVVSQRKSFHLKLLIPSRHLLAQNCQTCPKPTIKTSERHQWRRSGVVTVNPEHMPHPTPASQSPTPNMQLPAGYLQLN